MDNQTWNINRGFGDEVLVKLIVNLNNAMILNNVEDWLRILFALYLDVSGNKKMNKKIMEEVEEDLNNLEEKIELNNNSLVNKGQGYNNLIKRNLKKELRTITKTLITEMHKADLILPNHKNSPEFATLEM